MDPDERARFEDDYARATGVLPEAVLKQVRGGLLSADPAGQAAAATRLAGLKDIDPALVEAIPADERRRAQAIAEFADLGLQPARAVELAAEKPAGVREDDELAGGEGVGTRAGAIEEIRLSAGEEITEAGEDDELAGGGLPLGRDTLLRPAAKDDDLIGRIAALSNDVLNLALGEPDGRERGEKAARLEVADAGGSPLSGPGGAVQKSKKPAKSRPPAVGNAGPPTNKPVVLHDMYKKLGFDPNGKGQYEESLQTPIDGIRAALLADEAVKTVDKQIRKGRFTKASRNGGDADAFRHAYWNYRMTEELGPDAAKRFGDAREITAPGPDGDRLMDLFNNNVGRRLALDPANKGRPAEDVILDAMKKGQLQAQLFKILFKPAPGIPSRKKSP